MHFKRTKPRTQSRAAPKRFPSGSPSYWNIIYHSRPRRYKDKNTCREVIRTRSDDDVVWSLGNRKPTVYYW